MAGIADLIAASKEFGVFEFYLPFIIVFAIFYGLLSKANVFGTDKKGKNLNLVISGVAALFVIAYTPVGITLVEYFGAMFTGTVIVLVTLLASLMILSMLLGMAGVGITVSKAGIIFILIAILLAIGVFVASGGAAIFPWLIFPDVSIPEVPIPAIPAIGLSMQDIAMILMFFGTLVVVWWVQREEKAPKK